eukprot:1622180-Rhodomonas_salina.2
MGTEEAGAFPRPMEVGNQEVYYRTAVVQDSNYLADIEGPPSDKREKRTNSRKIKGFIECDLCGEYHHHMRRSRAKSRGVSCASLAPAPAIAPARAKPGFKQCTICLEVHATKQKCFKHSDVDMVIEQEHGAGKGRAKRPRGGHLANHSGGLHKRVYRYKKCKSCGAYHHWKSKCLSQLFEHCTSLREQSMKEEQSAEQMTDEGASASARSSTGMRASREKKSEDEMDCFACKRRHSWKLPCSAFNGAGASGGSSRNPVRDGGVFKRKFKGGVSANVRVGKKIRR